jgi:hypothetical protein
MYEPRAYTKTAGRRFLRRLRVTPINDEVTRRREERFDFLDTTRADTRVKRISFDEGKALAAVRVLRDPRYTRSRSSGR